MWTKLKSIFKKNDKKYFLVTSTGYSGNHWLASSLHLHPQIKCSMGIDALPAAFDYHYNAKEIVNIFKSEDIWYKNGILFPKYLFNLLEKLEKENRINPVQKKIYIEIINQAKSRVIDEVPTYVFQELNQVNIKKRAHIFGNVHGMTAGHLMNLIKHNHPAFAEIKDKLIIFDLIRHPVTRFDTYINYKAQWYDTEKYGSYVKVGVDKCMIEMADLVKKIEDQYNIDFTITRNKVYFWAEYANDSHLLSNYRDVAATPEIPRVLFESLHNDPDYYKTFFSQLTGILNPNKNYIKSVFSPKNLTQGRASAPLQQQDRHDPVACFERWSEWEKNRFRERVAENELDKFYAQFGYDLSL